MMLSIQGIYTGNEIKPLEKIHLRPNIRVIITFLEDDSSLFAPAPPAGNQGGVRSQTRTQRFLEKCGGWQDTRSPEELIADIYASRTSSERGVRLFQETD